MMRAAVLSQTHSARAWGGKAELVPLQFRRTRTSPRSASEERPVQGTAAGAVPMEP